MTEVQPTSTGDTCPRISVAIPTRNRAGDIQRCLQSLANVNYQNWDLLVVDQSDDERTREVVQGFAESHPMMTYHRLNLKGLSRARNYAMVAVTGKIVAFLDDDCTVDSDWLRQIADVFVRYPDVGLVFGSVDAPSDTDWTEVFVPTHEVEKESAWRGIEGLRTRLGIGASMYLRRSRALPGQGNGPFDVFLGSGVRAFPAAEELDYAYRALMAGQEIVTSPTIRVVHHGARYFKDGSARSLVRGSLRSEGAVHMKLLRCGKRGALLLIFLKVWSSIRAISVRNSLSRRGQTGIAQPIMYAWGLCGSFRLAVDRKNSLYRRRAPRLARVGRG